MTRTCKLAGCGQPIPDSRRLASFCCEGHAFSGENTRLDAGIITTIRRAIPKAVLDAQAQLRTLKSTVKPTKGSLRYNPKDGTIVATQNADTQLNLKDFRCLNAAMEEIATSYHCPLPYHMGTIRSRFEFILAWSDLQPKSIRGLIGDELANAYERDLKRESARWEAEDWAIEGAKRNVSR